MHISFLELLRCPFCAGILNPSRSESVSPELEYGVLSCYCSRFPVVAGIPIFKRGVIGSAGQTRENVIALIEKGRRHEALFSLLTPPSLPPSPSWISSLPSITGINRVKRFFRDRSRRAWQEEASILLRDAKTTACNLLELYFSRSKSKMVRDYFAFRFGHARHLVGLSFAASLARRPDKPVLDLACGCGHVTNVLVQQAEGTPVIGADPSFFGLYLAKRWTAPQATYICCAGDTALPFPSGAFSAVFCSDAFQFFISKVTSAAELKRLTRNHGTIVLFWVRNALVEHPYPGLALPPEGYQALVADMPHSLVADSEVLARYRQKQGPSLRHSAELERLADEPVLSIVASHRSDVFVDYGTFENWPHARGRLDLNPLYVKAGANGNGSISLRRSFPSPEYEDLNQECKSYLPESVNVNEGLWNDLANGRRTREIEKLVRQCVLLAIPERYGNPYWHEGNEGLPLRRLSAQNQEIVADTHQPVT
jgi:SAM-dependent methyltransferase